MYNMYNIKSFLNASIYYAPALWDPILPKAGSIVNASARQTPAQ
jgi:hypothetical protein